MRLSTNSINTIRAKGLYISDTPFFGPNHIAYPNGYIVIKPGSAGGNRIEGYEIWFTNLAGEQELSDAPGAVIFPVEKSWGVSVSEYVPGPGPGDFEKIFSSEQKAVSAIVEYYFGLSPEFQAFKRHHENKSAQ